MDSLCKDALTELAAGLSPTDLQEFLEITNSRDVAAGEALVTEGEPSDSLYLVVRGTLEVSVSTAEGPVVLAELSERHWVGEVGLLDPGPASATVRALGDATVLQLSDKELMGFVSSHPVAATVILRTLSVDLADRLRHMSQGALKVVDGNLRLVEAPAEAASGGFWQGLMERLTQPVGRA